MLHLGKVEHNPSPPPPQAPECNSKHQICTALCVHLASLQRDLCVYTAAHASKQTKMNKYHNTVMGIASFHKCLL